MAQSGNGVDLGMIYQLLTQMSARIEGMELRLDRMELRLNNMEQRLDQIVSVVNDHTRRQDDLAASVAELRSEVSQYHAAVTSQGIHYSELEGRTLRIERHLKLESGK